MRTLPIFGILAAATLLCVAGCGKNRSAWVGIEELDPPKTPSIQAGQLNAPRTKNHQHWTDLPSRRRENAGVHPTVHGSSLSAAVADRISEDRKDWEEYQSGLSSQSGAGESGLGSSRMEADKPESIRHRPESLISPAVRRRHSTEYVNLQMRIAVLEARMKSVEEPERKLLGVKLEAAKADLATCDAVCTDESRQTSIEPEADEPKSQQ